MLTNHNISHKKLSFVYSITHQFNNKNDYYTGNSENSSDLPIEQRKGMSKTLNPNFPENYIRDIVSLAREGYIVLISSHKEVRDELNKRRIPFTIVLPSLDMKQEMIDRYIKRGNQENFVTMLENNYETFVNDLMSDPNNKIVLDSGQYLKDVVRFI